MAGTTTIKANAAGSTGDLSKWNEDPGDAIETSDSVAKLFSLTAAQGDKTTKYTAGVTFTVTGSGTTPTCDGEYTVVSSSFESPYTLIVVASVPADSATGYIKKHRVPAAADVVDINGKRVVQDGAFTAVAEIKDVAASGKFVVTGPFTPTLVTDVVVFDALPTPILRIGD